MHIFFQKKMANCSHKIIIHNKNGNLSYCKKCARYRFVYLSTLLHFSYEQLMTFKTQVHKHIIGNRELVNCKSKTFVLSTFTPSCQMILNYNEIIILHQMLELANQNIQDCLLEKYKIRNQIILSETKFPINLN